jgi:ketosteroid isomerase-like protein
MERAAALLLLAELHAAQNAFYAGGDDSELRKLLSPDIEWTVPGRNAIAGRYRGPTEVLGYVARRRDLADQTFQMHRRDVLVGDGAFIAALTDGTAVVHGRERSWSTVGLYQTRGGLITRCWLLALDQAEFDDIWSG